MHPQTILAYAYNDRPAHGRTTARPLRLYSPIKLGYKMTKYLTRMRSPPSARADTGRTRAIPGWEGSEPEGAYSRVTATSALPSPRYRTVTRQGWQQTGQSSV